MLTDEKPEITNAQLMHRLEILDTYAGLFENQQMTIQMIQTQLNILMMMNRPWVQGIFYTLFLIAGMGLSLLFVWWLRGS